MDELTLKICRILTNPGYWLELDLSGYCVEAVMKRYTATFLMMAMLIAGAGAQKNSGADAMFEAAKQKENLGGDLNAAIKQYGAIVAKYKSDRAVTAMALVRL